jgi:hypothetical protein
MIKLDSKNTELTVEGRNKMRLFNFDFTRIGLFNRVIRSRLFQPILLFINLLVFVVLIMAGIFGSPVGNQNAAIILVWIFWFFLLIFLLIPLGGRSW